MVPLSVLCMINDSLRFVKKIILTVMQGIFMIKDSLSPQMNKLLFSKFYSGET
jgi:hypothetical protein